MSAESGKLGVELVSERSKLERKRAVLFPNITLKQILRRKFILGLALHVHVALIVLCTDHARRCTVHVHSVCTEWLSEQSR